ncbi:hypothetical protein J4G46_05235 [Acinetobacter towneri]|uniref:hypothetical protein n=1 Tax=Acinetobacter towneri TaxID=202956 RepID=UPI001AA09040|nr:hypothetical protein [Acinetobacter towneri]QTD65190.1 hypothetical protein J4G46_05235 [Acinetobacter towneri]
MLKIHKENNEDLGFVIGCLYSQAISLNEFRSWIEYVIEISDIENIPQYIFDLADFDDYLFNISKKVGFVASSGLSEEQKKALEGIAYLRSRKLVDPELDKTQALKLLDKYPIIMSRFRELFPFIEI